MALFLSIFSCHSGDNGNSLINVNDLSATLTKYSVCLYSTTAMLTFLSKNKRSLIFKLPENSFFLYVCENVYTPHKINPKNAKDAKT